MRLVPPFDFSSSTSIFVCSTLASNRPQAKIARGVATAPCVGAQGNGNSKTGRRLVENLVPQQQEQNEFKAQSHHANVVAILERFTADAVASVVILAAAFPAQYPCCLHSIDISSLVLSTITLLQQQQIDSIHIYSS